MKQEFLIDQLHHCPQCGSDDFPLTSEKSRHCNHCGFNWFMNPAAANVAFIVNQEGALLVERRGREPAKGTLDLPGGFCDALETGEEAVCREVAEETGLTVTQTEYLFSIPNIYAFSGVNIPTLDLFFRCRVDDVSKLKAADDAAECFFLPIEAIHLEDFGLTSVKKGLKLFLERFNHETP